MKQAEKKGGTVLPKFGIALKVKAKHGQIYNYMTEHNLSYVEMCKLLGVTPKTLADMLHFKWKPSKRKGNAAETIQKLERFFDCTIDELFPPELTEQIGQNKELRSLLQETHVIQKEIDIEYLPFEQLPEIEYTPDFDGFERTEKIGDVLKTLPPKYEKVIRLRFGLGCEEHTLEEVAAKMGCTRENIQRIQESAINKLKHPYRLKKLKELC